MENIKVIKKILNGFGVEWEYGSNMKKDISEDQKISAWIAGEKLCFYSPSDRFNHIIIINDSYNIIGVANIRTEMMVKLDLVLLLESILIGNDKNKNDPDYLTDSGESIFEFIDSLKSK